MHRAFIKILVGLAVALGLTLTASPVAGAAAGSVGSVGPVGTAAAVAAPNCAAQEAALAKSRAKRGKAVRAARHARNALAKARRAEQRAQTRAAKKARHQAVVRAKKRVETTRAKLAKKKRNVRIHKGRVRACRSTGSTPPRPPAPAPITSHSPLQALCDAGVPQDVCNALAGLAGLAPAAAATTPFDQLCVLAPEAQPLCDLLSGQVPTDMAAFQELVAGLLAELDPSAVQGVLAQLVELLGLGDLLDASALEDLLGDILGELGGLLDPSALEQLGGLADLLAGLLEQLGLGGLGL